MVYVNKIVKYQPARVEISSKPVSPAPERQEDSADKKKRDSKKD